MDGNGVAGCRLILPQEIIEGTVVAYMGTSGKVIRTSIEDATLVEEHYIRLVHMRRAHQARIYVPAEPVVGGTAVGGISGEDSVSAVGDDDVRMEDDPCRK